jgi:hypothetical protein
MPHRLDLQWKRPWIVEQLERVVRPPSVHERQVAEMFDAMADGVSSRSRSRVLATLWDRLVPHCLRVLDLEMPFTAEQIKAAFRRQVKKRHPYQGGSDAAFIELMQARAEALALLAKSGTSITRLPRPNLSRRRGADLNREVRHAHGTRQHRTVLIQRARRECLDSNDGSPPARANRPNVKIHDLRIAPSLERAPDGRPCEDRPREEPWIRSSARRRSRRPW